MPGKDFHKRENTLNWCCDRLHLGWILSLAAPAFMGEAKDFFVHRVEFSTR